MAGNIRHGHHGRILIRFLVHLELKRGACVQMAGEDVHKKRFMVVINTIILHIARGESSKVSTQRSDLWTGEN